MKRELFCTCFATDDGVHVEFPKGLPSEFLAVLAAAVVNACRSRGMTEEDFKLALTDSTVVGLKSIERPAVYGRG